MNERQNFLTHIIRYNNACELFYIHYTYKIIDYNKQNNISFSYKLLPDSKLQRGDLRVRSGSIEVGDIVSNKINFSDSSDLDLTLKFDTNNDELSNQPKQKPNT